MLDQIPSFHAPETRSSPGQASGQALREAARELESAFLAEMLRSAGVGAPRSFLGGGHGESQFASFLREAYAGEIAANGGIGLAERIFEALQRDA